MTPGGRLYRIRLACGDGLRRAEALVDFVKRVKRTTGEDYLPTTVSMLERDLQNWRLSDVRAFAAVDPKQRGAAWLSALDVPAWQVGASTASPPASSAARRVSPAELLARAKEEAKKAKPTRKKRPNHGG